MNPHDIYLMDPDGTNKVRITTDPAWEGYPVWSPDGTKIAFNRDGDIYVINTNGTGETRLTFTGDNGLGDWAPGDSTPAETISWQIKNSTMPTARSSAQCAVVGSDIYTLGGHGGSGTYSQASGMRENEVYHTSSDSWEQMGSIPSYRGAYDFDTAEVNN